MTSMIEKVARALCQRDGYNPDGANAGSCGDPFWKFYQDKARTALEAMREPSEQMIKAGVASGGWSDWYEEEGEFRAPAADCYRAMINAVLKKTIKTM